MDARFFTARRSGWRTAVVFCLMLVVSAVEGQNWNRLYNRALEELQQGDARMVEAAQALGKVLTQHQVSLVRIEEMCGGKATIGKLLEALLQQPEYAGDELTAVRQAYDQAQDHYGTAYKRLQAALKSYPTVGDLYVLGAAIRARQDRVENVYRALEGGQDKPLTLVDKKALQAVLAKGQTPGALAELDRLVASLIDRPPLVKEIADKLGYGMTFSAEGLVLSASAEGQVAEAGVPPAEETAVPPAEEEVEASQPATSVLVMTQIALGDELFAAGRYTEALALWESLPERDRPQEKIAAARQAQAQGKAVVAQQAQAAAEAARKAAAAARRGEEVAARIAEGDALLVAGRYTEALALWESLPEGDRPQEKIAMARRVQAEAAAQQQAEAEAAAQQQAKAEAAARRGEEVAARIAEGDALLVAGRYAEALSLWESLPEGDRPQEKIAMARRAQAEAAAQQQAKAEAAARQQAEAEAARAAREVAAERAREEAAALPVEEEQPVETEAVEPLAETPPRVTERVPGYVPGEESEVISQEKTQWEDKKVLAVQRLKEEDFRTALALLESIPEEARPAELLDQARRGFEAQQATEQAAALERARQEAARQEVATGLKSVLQQEEREEERNLDARRVYLQGLRAMRDVESEIDNAYEIINSAFERLQITRGYLRQLFEEEPIPVYEFFKRLEEDKQYGPFSTAYRKLRVVSGRLERAQVNFQSSVDLDPAFLDAYLWKLKVCLDLGWEPEVIRTYEKARQLPLENAGSMRNGFNPLDPALEALIFQVAAVYHENEKLVHNLRRTAAGEEAEAETLQDETPAIVETPSWESEGVLVVRGFWKRKETILDAKRRDYDSGSPEYRALLNQRLENRFAEARFYQQIGWKSLAQAQVDSQKADPNIREIFNLPERREQFTSAIEKIERLERDIGNMLDVFVLTFSIDSELLARYGLKGAKLSLFKQGRDPSAPLTIGDLVISIIPNLRSDVSFRKVWTSEPNWVKNEQIQLPKGLYSCTIELEGVSVEEENQMPIEIARGSSARYLSPIIPNYELAIMDRNGAVTALKLRREQYNQAGTILIDLETNKQYEFPKGVIDIVARGEDLDFTTFNAGRLEVRPTQEFIGKIGELANRVAQGGLGVIVLLFLMI